MRTSPLDLDRLARDLGSKLKEDELSLRQAAEQIGCSPATLSRLLQGSAAESTADTDSLIRAVSWLGKSLGDYDSDRLPKATTMNDVEMHLRALQDLSERDREALIAVVKAAHDAYRSKEKKS